jgi:transcriptional regulator with XRE-family HTH domain
MLDKKALQRFVAQRIRVARKTLKLTQFELAQQIGVPTSRISDVERGYLAPTLPLVWLICKHYGFSADFFLPGLPEHEEPGRAGAPLELGDNHLTSLYRHLPVDRKEYIKKLIVYLARLQYRPLGVQATADQVELDLEMLRFMERNVQGLEWPVLAEKLSEIFLDSPAHFTAWLEGGRTDRQHADRSALAAASSAADAGDAPETNGVNWRIKFHKFGELLFINVT